MTTAWKLVDGRVLVDPAAAPYDPSPVPPDPENRDSTDWPRRGCRRCGSRDRPQFEGVCNDDHCCEYGA